MLSNTINFGSLIEENLARFPVCTHVSNADNRKNVH